MKRLTSRIATLRAARRAAARGFTLVELLAAIVLIAVLAAIATPSFIAIMRDRRVTQVAVTIGDTYREARSRSLARGIAVAVLWQSDGAGKGTLQVRETVVLPPGQGLPKGCHNADWSDLSLDTRMVSKQNYASSQFELAAIKAKGESGADAPVAQICFAGGRSYVRYGDAGTFASLKGVPRFEVLNTRTNYARTVFVPPNGVARLAL